MQRNVCGTAFPCGGDAPQYLCVSPPGRDPNVVVICAFFLCRELKWLKTVDPAKADKAADRALKLAKMNS